MDVRPGDVGEVLSHLSKKCKATIVSLQNKSIVMCKNYGYFKFVLNSFTLLAKYLLTPAILLSFMFLLPNLGFGGFYDVIHTENSHNFLC